ncbi:hypothetical protein ZIOFF_069263 [Zingiber officinale]|uniref:Uncharacterized protein n=1 Tax=Zingiber officinale TaxID=94328 RepID=A0A8J5ECK1_ZINOF|nr:hypothetical protein ZIOFF_069263 [Zingiber officinale]
MYHGVPLGMAMVPGFKQPAHNHRLIQTHVAVDHFKVFQVATLNFIHNMQLMTVSTFASPATFSLKSSSSAYPPAMGVVGGRMIDGDHWRTPPMIVDESWIVNLLPPQFLALTAARKLQTQRTYNRNPLGEIPAT